MYLLIFLAAVAVPIMVVVLLVMIGAPVWVSILAGILCAYWLREAVIG